MIRVCTFPLQLFNRICVRAGRCPIISRYVMLFRWFWRANKPIAHGGPPAIATPIFVLRSGHVALSNSEKDAPYHNLHVVAQLLNARMGIPLHRWSATGDTPRRIEWTRNIAQSYQTRNQLLLRFYVLHMHLLIDATFACESVFHTAHYIVLYFFHCLTIPPWSFIVFVEYRSVRNAHTHKPRMSPYDSMSEICIQQHQRRVKRTDIKSKTNCNDA